MPSIGPKKTQADLDALNGGGLPDGRYQSEALPGVTADSKLKEPNGGHKKNRELAQKIRDVRKTLKGHDGDGKPHFVLAWRMYPNAESARWSGEQHTCGCGCGCS
jgi:hypothetical protein